MAEHPSTVGVTCPLCDVRVPCSVTPTVTAVADRDPGLVASITAVLTPDVVEQFAPHLREAHPVEFAQMGLS